VSTVINKHLQWLTFSELCLAVKTNPYAYDYDSSAWFPIVRPVAGVDTKAKLEDGPFSSDDEKPPQTSDLNGAETGKFFD